MVMYTHVQALLNMTLKSKKPRYPCVRCGGEVRGNSRAVSCDGCDEWTHCHVQQYRLKSTGHPSSPAQEFFISVTNLSYWLSLCLVMLKKIVNRRKKRRTMFFSRKCLILSFLSVLNLKVCILSLLNSSSKSLLYVTFPHKRSFK